MTPTYKRQAADRLEGTARDVWEKTQAQDRWLLDGLSDDVLSGAEYAHNAPTLAKQYRKHELVDRLAGHMSRELTEDELEDVMVALLRTPRDVPESQWLKPFPTLRGERTLVPVSKKEWMSYKVSDQLIRQWAMTSADDHPVPLAMQRIVKRELAKGGKLDHMKRTSSWEASEEFLKKHDKALTKFVRAMYEETQKALADAGIEELILYRGMAYKRLPKWMPDPRQHATARAPLQPASSFASDASIAYMFAGSRKGSMMMVIRVPRDRILGTARTGWGCLGESEWVVLGGKLEARVLNTGHVWSQLTMAEKKGELVIMESFDAIPENQDWTKQTWDITNPDCSLVSSKAELERVLESMGMTIDEFKRLPAYRNVRNKPKWLREL